MKRSICTCFCHAHEKATYSARKQCGSTTQIYDASRDPMVNVQPAVPTQDVLEAALACPLCLDKHVDALSLRAIWGEQHEKVPWVDPPPRKDDGEGAE